VNGDLLFGDGDKDVLQRMLWQVAEFSGVQVLTYCLLGNHFHVLVRVPARTTPNDAEILRRYQAMYPEKRPGGGPEEHRSAGPGPVAKAAAVLEAGGPEAENLRRALAKRMSDLSEFMKTLKQRFTMKYNATHRRYGTLWTARFTSVLLEDAPDTVIAQAAYIDLNPVRAKLVADPKDYRWSGYGEAVGGAGAGIRAGLGSILPGLDWESLLAAYRAILFGGGAGANGGG
jgi:REP element-mobilizing transposase RayT